jgi:hypothetical protein
VYTVANVGHFFRNICLQLQTLGVKVNSIYKASKYILDRAFCGKLGNKLWKNDLVCGKKQHQLSFFSLKKEGRGKG